MTKDEFITRFNAILANPTDTATAATFREDVIKDYDAANVNSTTLKTANDNIKKLEDENKNLKEVNYQMFISGFSKGGKEDKNDDGNVDDKDDENGKNENAPSVDSVINGLLGKENEDGE